LHIGICLVFSDHLRVRGGPAAIKDEKSFGEKFEKHFFQKEFFKGLIVFFYLFMQFSVLSIFLCEGSEKPLDFVFFVILWDFL
jgi:hypothetical protein